MRIEFTASDDIRRAITRLGRTEDIQFSPSGNKLAITGFHTNRLLLLSVDIDWAGAGPKVEVTDYLEITCAVLHEPHGLCWIGDDTLIVANRKGEVPIFNLPKTWPERRSVDLTPVRTLRTDDIDLLRSPGSVAVNEIADGLYEVLICNNFENFISQHLIDKHAEWSVLSSSKILSNGLNVPDGVAYSKSARWVGISNHYAHCVFLYAADRGLDDRLGPHGTLAGIEYPHGLRFTGDGRHMVVSDAGQPFVQIFASEDGDWSGERRPKTAIQVIDDANFAAGNHNPEEGGAKGIDLGFEDRILAVSCEEDPLVFFDVRDVLGTADDSSTAKATLDWTEGEMRLATFRRHLLVMQATQVEQVALMKSRSDQGALVAASAAQLQSVRQQLQGMLSSRSWRLTRPVRWLGALGRRAWSKLPRRH